MRNYIKFLILVLFSQFLQACGCTVVDPGTRGIKVNLGEVTNQVIPEGLVWHQPLLTNIVQVSIRQQTKEVKAECYSSDLQPVTLNLKVLYRLPEDKVVTLYQKFSGDPFDALVAPRVNEALKEVTALLTAEGIVKSREKVKTEALAGAKAKVGDLVIIEDIVIENVDLSDDLEKAIESKMVQQQEAAKAEFTKQKAQIEAETALIRAQGEANAINVRGKAIKENPGLVDLTIAEKWNGVAPLVVGAGNGANILLPMEKK